MRLFSKLTLLVLITCLSGTASAQPLSLKFAVLVMDVDDETRKSFEEDLVKNLQRFDYEAVASYNMVPEVDTIKERELKAALLAQDVRALLVLRPIDIGDDATIETARLYMTTGEYDSIQQFVDEYRGHNFASRAVVHVGGFLLDDEVTTDFWQGVLWLDEEVETVQDAMDRLSELVTQNLNQSRPEIRRRLGMPPLN